MNIPASHISTDFDQVPAYLKEARRWLLWRRQQLPADKKPRKVPYYVNGNRRTDLDSPRDHAQLVSFDEARAALQRAAGIYAGLGFALGSDGNGGSWQGIDLDSLSSRPELRAEIDRLSGYVEYSPSGDGAHAIGYGRSILQMGSDGSGVETYCRGRFFTLTGSVIKAGPKADLTADVLRLLRYRGSRKDAIKASVSNENSWASAYNIDPELARDLRSALPFWDHDSYEEWIAAAHALKGGDDAGFEIWDEWSRRSQLYDPAEARQKWESIHSPHSGIGAIFKRAEERGWVNPKRVREGNTVGPRSAANDESYHREFGFVSAGELLTNLAPPRYLVQDYIEEESLSLLFGEPGAGKSFLALDWCCCIATGAAWNGREVTQGPVFYIAGEGHSGIGRRLKAWELHHGHPLGEASLFVSKAAASLMDEASAQSVHHAVAGLINQHAHPVLVVVDTLHRNLGAGDENSAEDVAAFLSHIDLYIRKPFNCAVLVVHHSGHADKSRARGSSSIQGAMDSMFGLLNVNGLPRLTCLKQKDGEPPGDQYFAKKVIDLSFAMGQDSGQSSLVLVPANPEEVKGAQPAFENQALKILRTLLDEQASAPPQSVLETHPNVLAVVTREVWKRRYLTFRSDGSIKTESIQKAFSRELRQLLEQGVVLSSGNYVWLED